MFKIIFLSVFEEVMVNINERKERKINLVVRFPISNSVTLMLFIWR